MNIIKIYNKFLFFLILLLGIGFKSNGQNNLILNEIMQSNIDCLMDDDHEFPDSWVELYNPTDSKISLKGYALGDKKKYETAFQLPSDVSIDPRSYFIVYCDKVGSNRHADFRLDSGKGSVYLFFDGNIVDKIEDFKAQPAPNVAYGRESDGADVWGYQLIPSPGESNVGGISNIILGDPVFNIRGRISSSPISLVITLPEDAPKGTIIRYTLDGSEPLLQSPVFDGTPLDIAENTIVRAKLFCNGAISPRATTHSYIFHPRKMTIPIISLVTNDEYLFGDELGILSDAITVGGRENFWYDWRRPVNIEYFVKEESPSVVNQICETRVKGKSTRKNILKSMVLYANKRFGTKRFEYEFFPEQRPGITDFKSLEARNGGNDANRLNIRDAVCQRMIGENTDIEWQAWQPTVVYINGKYHGILNIRERGNEDNIYTHYDGLEDIDLIENWKTAEEGTLNNFEAFKAFYSQDEHSFEEFKEWMDIEEFINYFIVNMYYVNYDFPSNNMVMWRPSYPNGKWRWICKDMDFSLSNHYGIPFDFDYLDWLCYPEKYPLANDSNKGEDNLLFKRLLAIPEFVKKFTDTFFVYTGDFLTDEATINKMTEMWEEFKEEWPDHYEKNTFHWGSYTAHQNRTFEFIRNRHMVIHDHICDWFDLGSPVSLQISDPHNQLDKIYMQNIGLRSKGFNGKFPQGHEIIVHSEQYADNFTGWIIESIDEKGEVNKFIQEGKILKFKMPLASRVKIYPNYVDASVDQPLIDEEEAQFIEYYDLSGRKCLGTLTPGIYIKKKGSSSEKVIIR